MPSLLRISVYLPGQDSGQDSDPADDGEPEAALGGALQLPLCEGGAQGSGSCAFLLSQPAGAAERQALGVFCGQLGQELQRAQQHLAKERLEVRLRGSRTATPTPFCQLQGLAKLHAVHFQV